MSEIIHWLLFVALYTAAPLDLEALTPLCAEQHPGARIQTHQFMAMTEKGIEPLLGIRCVGPVEGKTKEPAKEAV